MRPAIVLLFLFLALPTATKPYEQDVATEFPDILSVSGYRDICGVFEKQSKTDMDQFKHFYCVGWTSGFVAGYNTAEINAFRHPTAFCLPEGNTFGQIIRVILKFMNDHPESEQLGTRVLALGALEHAFPCKK
jgi:hypothetical protein